ncbi:MAG TPA: transglycosylase domain-containing protein [Candidatus Limnocylindrales bacterium]
MLASRASAQRRPPRTPIGQVLLVAGILAVIALVAVGGVVALAAVGVVNAMAQGLPDPTSLQHLTFDQPTIVYDRTGKIELARFQLQDRHVVTYAELPPLVLDAVTTAEDRTFWQNDGFDPGAIVAAAFQNAAGSGDTDRGASTITQQLVRARLLPPDVTAGDRYVRKVLEIIQSARVTQAYPGEQGKQEVITAYLNEVYFGHEAYGIGAAAEIYFGVDDLSKLTPAQAALIAGLVKAPSLYDPYRYAVPDAQGKLVVPADAPPVVRRNYILTNLAASARWTHLSPADLQAALAEPVVLTPAPPPVMKAPQFSWQVRDQLEQMLGGAAAVDTGGYKVITSLDWNAQVIAERDVAAAAIAPNLTPKFASYLLTALKVPAADRGWVANLRGKDLHNGLLVAVDYRHGDVLAYVGSAGYYRTDIASPKFQPEFDAANAGRQPGSSFKPIVYSTAFDRNVLDPGSLLLDIQTDFGGGWTPKDADEGERGPVTVRTALQQSLNLPAIRALQRVGSPAVVAVADKLGVNFPGGDDAFLQAGLAGAIGTVETRPIDLTSAFGGLANGGVHVPNRMILSVTGPDGQTVFQAPDKPQGVQAVSAQTSFLISDVLAGNSDPAQNPIWATALGLHNTSNGARRPAAAKTGTTDDVRDLSTYGFLAPPTDPNSAGLAVGVWLGNSDHSKPRTDNPANSLAAANMWRSFVRDYTKDWPNATFKPPSGVVNARIDAWSGGAPGPWTRDTRLEWFKSGTQPGGDHAIDTPGLLYSSGCGGWMVDPVKAELGPSSWDKDVANWLDRAKRGAGVTGPYGSHTAYLAGHGNWGGPLLGDCKPKPSGGGGGGGGHHHHGGGGGGGQQPPASPATSPAPSPSGRRRRLVSAG